MKKSARCAGVAGALLFVGGSSALAQQPPVVVVAPLAPDEGRLAFERGFRALQERRLGEAEIALREAMRLRPTPLTVYNLALTLRSFGRYVEAVELFDRYLREPETGAAPERLNAIRDELATIRARVARLDITLQPATALLRVDGHAVQVTTSGLRLDPGAHVFDVEAEGYERDHREITLAPGAQMMAAIALRAQASEGRLHVEPSVASARVSIDGQFAAIGRVERAMTPGDHVIEVTATGCDSWRRTVRVTPRGTLRLDVALQTTRPASSSWLWPVIIGGSALVVGGIVTGIAFATRGDEVPVRGNWGNFNAQ